MCRSTVGTVCTKLYQAYGDMVYIKVPSCTERIGPLLDWYVSSIPSVSSGLALEDKAEFAISICTVRYGQYIPVRQVIGMRYCPRLIEGEIDRRRSIEGEKGKKKKKRKRRKKEEKEKKNLLSTRRPRPCVVAALARGCSFSRVRRRNVSPCGEKDRGDVAWYGRYILVNQVIGMRYARYRAIPPKIDRRRPIEGEKGKKKKRKRRKKNLLSTRRPRPCAVAALARGCSFSRARRRNVSP
ncbi:hypothetical protein BHE74_00034140 [Ensete ventricosum]|nr:hypothetical protein BHE74_00034140 [Ensete ventricosum]